MAAVNLSDEARINIKKGLPTVKRYGAFDNIPVTFGQLTMATTTTTLAVEGALTTDIVVASVANKDTTAVSAVEVAKISPAGTLSIKMTAAVGTGDGVVSYVILRPTTPV